MADQSNSSGIYPPPPRVSEDSFFPTLASYEKMYAQSMDNPEMFWGSQAEVQIDWFHKFTQVMDCDFANGMVAWFLGGKLNVCHNCVDRHLDTRGDKIAILWEGDEPGDVRRITYRELHREVCKLANVLRHNGIRKGDRVAI
ncbi:MAG: AMP-binding protein [Pontiella sp.]|nr:AMP-binding protein [Pontiella sp.]